MSHPLVSVIIPAYNGATFLGATIESVLAQSYPNLELIIIDDASPDHTSQVVAQFDDHRLKYLVHPKNSGSDIARDTGIRASSGDFIAFLDQDDLFHPDKLQIHVAFLNEHTDVGLSYNARFDLDHSSETIRGIWRPPHTLGLADLVLGFPLSPSDLILRRKWAFEMDLLGGSLSWCGGEIVHFGNLYLGGCKFASVNRVLNYRRYHSRRILKDLSGGCKSEIHAQDKIFADPRCPLEVQALHEVAHSNLYAIWAYRAFIQEETELGQELVREAVSLNPSIAEGVPCDLVKLFLVNCIDDEKRNHESLLRKLFAQLPQEMTRLSDQCDWAVKSGYLLKGARAIMWNRPEDGRQHFNRAAGQRAQVDGFFLSAVTQQLLDYETEFGAEATQQVLCNLSPYLKDLGGQASVRELKGQYSVNQAFESYRAGEYNKVPAMTWRAVANNPKYLANRGVISILLHSTLDMRAKPKFPNGPR